MLYALARKGDAPRWFLELNSRGVPIRAILVGTVFGYLSVIMSYVSPDKVFLFLVNSSGVVALFIYLLIAVSQLRMRARLEAEHPERLQVRMWGYPVLTYLTIAGMLSVIASMAWIPSMRSQLWASLLSFLVVLVAYAVRERWSVRQSDDVSQTKGA
jgi:GABA permease